MGIPDPIKIAYKDRVPRSDPFWQGKKKNFAIATIASFLLLQLIFLANYSYLFGTFHNTMVRVKALNILIVDYDNSVVGQSIAGAAGELNKTPSLPDFQLAPVSSFPDPANVIEAVRVGNYWGAVYIQPGATQRLEAALAGGQAAVAYLEGEPGVTWVWNEVRYAAVQESAVFSGIQTLLSVSRFAYFRAANGTAVRSVNTSDPAALQVIANPITYQEFNIKPTNQGPRVLYNTAVTVMPPLMQFFFLMALNSISQQFQFYSHLPILDNGFIRLGFGLAYSFFGGLCMAGYIWAFKEDWDVSGTQFILTWMVLWLCNHVNFTIMDCATGFIPISFLPFFVLTWIFINITSTVWPFELSPGFYKIGYALPAHETWVVLIQIWSGGGLNRLYQALPILFSWEILCFPFQILALYLRCIRAKSEVTKQEEMIDERVQTSLERLRRENETRSPKRSSWRSSWGMGGAGRASLLRMNSRDEYAPALPIPFITEMTRTASEPIVHKEVMGA
ncbi:Hypothetical protein D9617_7g030000 [Elsinoe fawcettii]|nr:Hypothetical protein D9617_7g030000 [Elsinoe fawcettii]